MSQQKKTYQPPKLVKSGVALQAVTARPAPSSLSGMA